MSVTFFLIIKHRICTIHIFQIFNLFIKISGTRIFFHSIHVNLKIDKMIALNHDIINRQAGNLENKSIIYCWETYKFHFIEISSNRN